MLRRLPATALLSVFMFLGAWADNGVDSTVKQGWSVNPLPSMAYDSDFGLMAGGIIDINYYGGLYPNYRHRLCLEALTYSKHASYYMFQYDSKYLIPGIRTSFKAYLDDNPLYWFYGFNGSVNDYDRDLNCNHEKGIAYYSIDRVFLNTRLEFSGPLVPNLDWTSKLSYWHYWIKELNWQGYDHANTLFRKYRSIGLIENAESDGGDVRGERTGADGAEDAEVGGNGCRGEDSHLDTPIASMAAVFSCTYLLNESSSWTSCHVLSRRW